MRYPFNEFGFNDYIKEPIRQIFIRQKMFKNVKLYSWDLYNVTDVVFAQFKLFCRMHPYFFVERYCYENNAVQFWKSRNVDHEAIAHDKLEAYRKLMSIQDYVLNIREVNKAKLEKIESDWQEYYRYRDIHTIEFWFENNELIYTLRKVNSTLFSITDIERAIDELDIKIAQEILNLKNYIYD